jgi:hypothetical protein
MRFGEQVAHLIGVGLCVQVAILAGLLFGCARPPGRFPPPASLPGPLYTWPVTERTIPAGQPVFLRTTEPIVAESVLPKRTFSAIVVRDVLNRAGEVLIPAGSPVTLVVLASPGGELALGLHSITVRGNRYLVRSSSLGPATNGPATAVAAPLGDVFDSTIGASRTPDNSADPIQVTGAEIRVPRGAVLVYRLTEPIEVGVLSGRDGA